MDNGKRINRRILFFACVLVLMLSLLILRLFYIQIIEGKGYAKRAASQRMLDLPLDVSRGQIYDRNMIPLTGRTVVNSLVVFPAIVDDKDTAARLISEITNLSDRDAVLLLEGDSRPIKLSIADGKEDRTIPEEVKGLMIVKDVVRYDDDSVARHLIGYVDGTDRIGRAGLEKLYHYYLAGQRDVSIAAMVDGSKRLIPGLGYKARVNSEDIEYYNLALTIDYHIQRVVEEVMDKKRINGAVVVLDVGSGEVLAMASRPDYRQDSVGDYLDGKNGELLNKAIQQYNLGSIFKIVVTAALLERNLVNPFEKVYCPGYTYVGDIQVKCSSFEDGGHGELNIYEAFARSCNTFYIEMGKRVGGEAIIRLAQEFGYGSITGINPFEEQPGLLPDINQVYKADIGNLSIGQGKILVTPIQVADMTNTIANNGIRKVPTVVKGLVSENGKLIQAAEKTKPEQIISPFVAMEIRKMMEMVVEEGTGKAAAIEGWEGSAGKTSSAQTGQRIGESEIVHAWFTGYVPKVRPKYVITVMAENGKSGGSVAAPVFRDIAQGILDLGDRH
ncbi:MAG: Cell division protein FtsI [Peptidoglycan synthetase] [Firmicutes bacterium]|nr:Cell division protein FtsI [Peptidoglycan synthetase] [Bacillota bacterium]MDI6706790.1 penicillin-binding transpeptidase domain-containing protein [Bacillota bacterium]